MVDALAAHYAGGLDEAAPDGGALVERIAARLRQAGKRLDALTTADLAPIDEFHSRGRRATLELAAEMGLVEGARVLDIGSGLGGPARTLAETHGCHVTGIDLTPAFSAAAEALSAWVGLAGRVTFRQGDATALPFPDRAFDAAMTIHVAMNIAAKDALYAEARRVLKPGGTFAVYDVLQGEGGAVLYPVPWARDPATSHLATPAEMATLLTAAGFTLRHTHDSTAESEAWFARTLPRLTTDPPPLTLATLLGDAFPQMARNQLHNLAARRIRTVSYVCEA